MCVFVCVCLCLTCDPLPDISEEGQWNGADTGLGPWLDWREIGEVEEARMGGGAGKLGWGAEH